MRILWLASWYPSRIDPFNGDFIQRHADAVSLLYDVDVIHVINDPDGRVTRSIHLETIERGRVTERIVYYHNRFSRVPIFGRVWNYFRYEQLFRKQVLWYLKTVGKPALTHVQVPWKAGLIGRWLKKKYALPFVLTEHWGIYNNTVADNIHTKSFLFRQRLKRVFRAADAFISVSHFLGKAVLQTVVDKQFVIIPNVVDTALFFPAGEKAQAFRFIHVSNMVPLKNVEGIIAGFKQFLQTTKANAELVLIGNRDDHFSVMAGLHDLSKEQIFFRGEVSHADVAKEMQASHVLVLNSDMENAPCVIGEALCCGLPVIATAVGGILELVNESNGILVPPRNVQALAAAMVRVVEEHGRFNEQQIAASAQIRFSPNVIADLHQQIYGLKTRGAL